MGHGGLGGPEKLRRHMGQSGIFSPFGAGSTAGVGHIFQGLNPEPLQNPEAIGKSRSEMDSAPLKQGGYILSALGTHLYQPRGLRVESRAMCVYTHAHGGQVKTCAHFP